MSGARRGGSSVKRRRRRRRRKGSCRKKRRRRRRRKKKMENDDAVAEEGYVEEQPLVGRGAKDCRGRENRGVPKKKKKVENGGGGLGREFWWRGSDLSDATAGSKLDILPPESALFSTNYFYLWLHDGYGHGRGGVGRGRQRTRKRRVNAINTSALWMPAII